jgi:hypothetical protein
VRKQKSWNILAIVAVVLAMILALMAISRIDVSQVRSRDNLRLSTSARALNIDPARVSVRWCIDVCAQSLRNIVIGRGGTADLHPVSQFDRQHVHADQVIAGAQVHLQAMIGGGEEAEPVGHVAASAAESDTGLMRMREKSLRTSRVMSSRAR